MVMGFHVEELADIKASRFPGWCVCTKNCKLIKGKEIAVGDEAGNAARD